MSSTEEDAYEDDFESEASPMKSSRSSKGGSVLVAPAAASSSSRAPALPPLAAARSTSAPKRLVKSSGGQRQASVDSTAALGKQRSASSLGRRVVTESSALIPLAGDEHTELAALQQINIRLRAELLDLNRQLDAQLGRKGQYVSRVHNMPRGPSMLPSDRLAAKNEQQRRINAELRELARRPHMHAITEAANVVGHYVKLLETAMGEMKGLENVLAHQAIQLERIALVEKEMADAQARHNDETREWKERGKAFKDARESDMAAYNKFMRQVERLEEKLRVQEEVGAAVKTVADVTEEVAEKDRLIDALKYQVAVLSKTTGSDKKRAQALNDRIAQELHSLREEAESLRKQIKALGMAGELGVDTRM